MIVLILFVALVPYCIVVLTCAALFFRESRRESVAAASAEEAANASSSATPCLTVVVCTTEADARVCAASMPKVAASLRAGDLLIVVADHVSEASLALLRGVAAEIGGAARVVENDGPKGKKGAQRRGVSMAGEGSVVVSVDADCVVGERFAEVVRTAAGEAAVRTAGNTTGKTAEENDGRDFMLLLPVEMCGGSSLLGKLVELEFGCLQVVTGGTAMMGRPTMSNGAGMAFTRALFMGHDSHSAYASGDDMFLLAHALQSGAEVRYLAMPGAVVRTDAPGGVGGYLRQRTRWLAKAGGYRSAGVIVLALVVFVAVMAWPVAALAAAVGWLPWAFAAGVFVAKWVADASACAAWLVFRRGWRGLAGLWVSVPLEVLYPLMTVVVAARALVADRRRW